MLDDVSVMKVCGTQTAGLEVSAPTWQSLVSVRRGNSRVMWTSMPACANDRLVRRPFVSSCILLTSSYIMNNQLYLVRYKNDYYLPYH